MRAMHGTFPAALFLDTADGGRDVPALAAACGLRSLAVPWQRCEARDNCVVLRGGYEIDANGHASPLPGTTLLNPAIVIALAPQPALLRRGRDLVAASGSLWGHCDLLASSNNGSGARHRFGTSRKTSNLCDAVFGVVEFHASSIPLRLASPPGLLLSARGCKRTDPDEHPTAFEERATRAFEIAIRSAAANLTTDPILHRMLAPCAVAVAAGAEHTLIDALAARPSCEEDLLRWREALEAWFQVVRCRAATPQPVVVPDRLTTSGPDATDGCALQAAMFPSLFSTPQLIDTTPVPDAHFLYIDPELQAADPRDGEGQEHALRRLLCRTRRNGNADDVEIEQRLVEPGVGRACLVPDLRIRTRTDFHDFTALGIGLTPFSEGGYVEIGRTIDGKASLVRAWHRKAVAERLEQEGCRTSRVVAIIGIPGADIEMPDGTLSPCALVARSFRCAIRLKQLDPLICCLHSIQHTPLVFALIEQRVRGLRTAHGLNSTGGLDDHEQLARALESQDASQESLRDIVDSRSLDHGADTDWHTLVRRVRLEAIGAYAPVLIDVATRRLAWELAVPESAIQAIDYLDWFAGSVGDQLRTWRRIRFLHDYHHPGVGRWQPGYLYTLGENNVTLLAEFPDLDTGVFVDDDPKVLESSLQLTAEDVSVLRAHYDVFHQRELRKAETIVRTLARILFGNDSAALKNAMDRFSSSYGHDNNPAGRA